LSNVAKYGALLDFGDAEELFVTWRAWSRKDLCQLMQRDVSLGESTVYRSFCSARCRGAQAVHDALDVFPPDDCRFEGSAESGLSFVFPYHDPVLNAYVKALPVGLRYSKEQSKILLRCLYRRYFPETLWGIRKHYFSVPVQEILSHRDYALVRDYLDNSTLEAADLVPAKTAMTWVRRFLAGDNTVTFKIWALLVLHAWLKCRW
jgi:hypothetical protein